MTTEPLSAHPQPALPAPAKDTGADECALVEQGQATLAEWEAEHGPITDAELDALERKLSDAGAEWRA